MFSYLFCRHSTTKYTLYEDFVRDPRAREQSDVYDFGFSNEMYYWVQVARECTGIKYKGRTGSMRKAETEKHEKKKKRIRIKLRIFFFFFIITISIYLLNTRTCYRGHRFFTRCANFDRVLPFISPKANWLLRTMKCRINFIFKFSLPLDNVLRDFLRLKMFLLLGNGFSYRFFDDFKFLSTPARRESYT